MDTWQSGAEVMVSARPSLREALSFIPIYVYIDAITYQLITELFFLLEIAKYNNIKQKQKQKCNKRRKRETKLMNANYKRLYQNPWVKVSLHKSKCLPSTANRE